MAATYDLECEQNGTFMRQVTWYDAAKQPVDLTGSTARMQVRKSWSEDVLLDLSTENQRIFLGGPNGTILLYIEPAAIDPQVLPPGTYRYDLIVISPSGVHTPVMKGRFIVQEGITRTAS